MKKPRSIHLAEQYCDKRYGFNNHEYDAFLAGYDAAKAIIEAELKSEQENKRFSTVIHRPSVEAALSKLLDKMEE